jgi:SAM-dependent methyltransferase
MRVIEIGCGMGRYTLLLAKLGFNVEGLDLSPFLLKKLSEFGRGRYRIPLHCADIVHPPVELLGQFDTVVGFFTLHHLHDLLDSFKSMTRLLKPGGCLVFLEPNPYNPLYYLQILLTPGMTWKGDGGMLRMRRSIIFRAMRNAGLSRLAMSRFGFFPPFLSNRPWGHKIEMILERAPILHPLLPFQIFRGQR